MPEGLSTNRTYLAFDFGLTYIGVAVGQTLTLTATALTTLRAKHGQPNWPEVKALKTDWCPHGLVVGYPLNMDGSEQKISKAAKKFAQALEEYLALPVHLVDERLSTVAAREQLYEQGGYRALKKEKVDSLAAQLILESFLREGVTR